jgi:deoxyribonuclease V
VEPWPASAEELVREQERLALAAPPQWHLLDAPVAIGGCFVCFERGPSGPGRKGERAWAAAATFHDHRLIDTAVLADEAGDAYMAGLLALREGALLAAAVRGLTRTPEVLLVDATGRDHPRRAGLAVHLGAILDLPTVGVTHRPLVAEGSWPDDERHARSPLRLEGEVVGYWLRTRAGTRPLAIHAAWRTDPETAVGVVVASLVQSRTPEPLRAARREARTARAGLSGSHALSSRFPGRSDRPRSGG